MDVAAIKTINRINKGCLSVAAVLRMLMSIDAKNDTLLFDQQRWVVADLPDLPVMTEAAATFMVSFYGGPPGKVKWWEGSLLTFLEDRLLYMTVYLGPDAVKRRCPRAVAILSRRGFEEWYVN